MDVGLVYKLDLCLDTRVFVHVVNILFWVVDRKLSNQNSSLWFTVKWFFFLLNSHICIKQLPFSFVFIVWFHELILSHWAGILTALTWPASLLAAASVIDHPWCICLNRSAEVGKHLAQVLRSRQQVEHFILPLFVYNLYCSILCTRD